MYIEAVLKGYRMPMLRPDPEVESLLEYKSTDDLRDLFNTLREPHNTTDTIDRKRLIKAIRIGLQESRQTGHQREFPDLHAKVFGIAPPREELRQRITSRLHERLEHGMVEEVIRLLASGIREETLKFYGLEYKFITLYLQKQLSYEEMVSQLNHAIHQFAKRQLTWFRRMERQGVQIRWIDHALPLDRQLEEIISCIRD